MQNLKIKKRKAICEDCGHNWIKIFRGCSVKKPRCYVCKSTNTTIHRQKGYNNA